MAGPGSRRVVRKPALERFDEKSSAAILNLFLTLLFPAPSQPPRN
jgi:hypothetical protein